MLMLCIIYLFRYHDEKSKSTAASIIKYIFKSDSKNSFLKYLRFYIAYEKSLNYEKLLDSIHNSFILYNVLLLIYFSKIIELFQFLVKY